ncbi:MoaD/ThiS family protein [uncultured Castellaniella sp.]|uniref:MoaD/ThiS family protein n=1 Tax=uncultured Castellaniella sp. TaxID=647907 RepID=UPI0026101E55|nr:MoaD/ThiS family protein [uncultured Castellaniella sp.]
MNGATINVLYFAQVAEHLGIRQETQALDAPIPAGDWLDALTARCPALGPSARLKLAINQEHAGRQDTIRPGDEVAVFEPVTGG